MRTQTQALDVLYEVYSCCDPIFGTALREAYLYGSYARGDYHEESDIDILLTVDLQPEAITQARKAIASVTSELSLKHDITVSVTVKSHDQFKKFASVLPYYQNVLKEGIRYAV